MKPWENRELPQTLEEAREFARHLPLDPVGAISKERRSYGGFDNPQPRVIRCADGSVWNQATFRLWGKE